MPLRVVIFSWGAGNQQYGLGQDARIMESMIRTIAPTTEVAHKDPHAFVGRGKPLPADIHIYLEVPCRVAFAWARVNIVIPNAEWWYTRAWSWVAEAGALFWFRTRHCESLFERIGIKGRYIGWSNNRGLAFASAAAAAAAAAVENKALYVVGGSKHKKAAADTIVAAWKPEWPRLTVLCADERPAAAAACVEWRREYLSDSAKKQLQATSRYHVVASQAEGFGYTMIEAVSHNALILRTAIPVYEEVWGGLSAGRIAMNPVDASGCDMLDPPRSFTTEAVVVAMTSLLKQKPRKSSVAKEALLLRSEQFRKLFTGAWTVTAAAVAKGSLRIPTAAPTGQPVMGVVTLVHNRPRWFSHAVRNIETSDWPREKLIWVVVDDSDGVGRVDNQIERAIAGLPNLQIEYVSLGKKTPIGEKRNRGIAAAIAKRPDISVLAFMDDDDHYPACSLSLRYAWLTASGRDCVYASTLPMYDITRYISAINVPPLTLSPCERVSEATLCFKREFWETRAFPDTISVAEGEEFLRGREDGGVEIPPDGVIVSFLHGKNFTSRRVPENKEPNGCHYGFSDEYFTMVSQLAGLVV